MKYLNVLLVALIMGCGGQDSNPRPGVFVGAWMSEKPGNVTIVACTFTVIEYASIPNVLNATISNDSTHELRFIKGFQLFPKDVARSPKDKYYFSIQTDSSNFFGKVDTSIYRQLDFSPDGNSMSYTTYRNSGHEKITISVSRK
jgi:hypothetical protein